ncbi:MAG TPA: hypothetical protein VHE37_02550 [Nevskiaceae bacterium]|nr:hypothetical protein [Nevskiaceae bacterium]
MEFASRPGQIHQIGTVAALNMRAADESGGESLMVAANAVATVNQ